jgi:hypothetical protein
MHITNVSLTAQETNILGNFLKMAIIETICGFVPLKK